MTWGTKMKAQKKEFIFVVQALLCHFVSVHGSETTIATATLFSFHFNP